MTAHQRGAGRGRPVPARQQVAGGEGGAYVTLAVAVLLLALAFARFRLSEDGVEGFARNASFAVLLTACGAARLNTSRSAGSLAVALLATGVAVIAVPMRLGPPSDVPLAALWWAEIVLGGVVIVAAAWQVRSLRTMHPRPSAAALIRRPLRATTGRDGGRG